MRETERMIRELFAIFTIQFNTQSRNTVLSKMSNLLFISWRRTRCFEHYTVCTSYCLWGSQNLSKYVITCQSNLPAFCVDREKENPPKPYRVLPQASHGTRASHMVAFPDCMVHLFAQFCRSWPQPCAKWQIHLVNLAVCFRVDFTKTGIGKWVGIGK